MIFMTPLGVVGAALATSTSETISGLFTALDQAKVSLLLRRLSLMKLVPLLHVGASVLGWQLAINVSLVAAARRK
jgi:Na+-driven multidrug efflux pump